MGGGFRSRSSCPPAFLWEYVVGRGLVSRRGIISERRSGNRYASRSEIRRNNGYENIEFRARSDAQRHYNIGSVLFTRRDTRPRPTTPPEETRTRTKQNVIGQRLRLREQKAGDPTACPFAFRTAVVNVPIVSKNRNFCQKYSRKASYRADGIKQITAKGERP